MIKINNTVYLDLCIYLLHSPKKNLFIAYVDRDDDEHDDEHDEHRVDRVADTPLTPTSAPDHPCCVLQSQRGRHWR